VNLDAETVLEIKHRDLLNEQTRLVLHGEVDKAWELEPQLLEIRAAMRSLWKEKP
jgi:hypothetical protein